MKIFKSILYIVIIVAFSCCEKADFSKSNTDKPKPSSDDTTYVISVSDALYLSKNISEDSLSYYVKYGILGYIVGAVSGTSLSSANFTLPINVETNILIADDSLETDPWKCMPIRLTKGTDYRAALNLQSHPENKGRKIVLYGYMKSYFLTTGIKDILSYKWLTDKTDTTANDTVHVNPYIVYTPEVIHGGR